MKSLSAFALICGLIATPATAGAADRTCQDLFGPREALVAQLWKSLTAKTPDRLEAEAEQARRDFRNAVHLIETKENSAEIDGLIRTASRAQIRFSEIHNRLVALRGGYLILPMDIRYFGENFKKARYNRQFLSVEIPPDAFQQIYYFSHAERDSLRVQIHDGFLYSSRSEKITNRIGTAFIMDENGEIFLMPPSETRNNRRWGFRHSSLAGGEPVAAAGHITLNSEGRVIVITRRSGHYKTTRENLKQVVERLKNQGVDLSDTVIGGT